MTWGSLVPLSCMSLKAWTPWELWFTVSPWWHSGEGSPELQFLCCGSISQSASTFQCLWLICFHFFSEPCPSFVENSFVGLQHWWLWLMQRPPTRSYLLTQSAFIDWSEVFFSKRTPRRPGPFCIMLMALDLRGKKRQVREAQMLPGRMSSLPPSEESGPTLKRPAIEQVRKSTLFILSQLPKAFAGMLSCLWSPRKEQELGSQGLTNHSGVHLRVALTSACSVWQTSDCYFHRLSKKGPKVVHRSVTSL